MNSFDNKMIKYDLEGIKFVGQSLNMENPIIWVTGHNQTGELIELGLINYTTILDVDGCPILGLELSDVFDHDLIYQDFDQDTAAYTLENGLLVEDFEGLKFKSDN